LCRLFVPAVWGDGGGGGSGGGDQMVIKTQPEIAKYTRQPLPIGEIIMVIKSQPEIAVTRDNHCP
jgi:hypothetical protein